MSEDKKKNYYYGGKEKKAIEAKKQAEEIVPYSFGEIQQDFDRMMERFEREFEDFWEIPSRMRHGIRRHALPIPFRASMMPSVDLEDQGNDYRLTMDLPGFSKEDVEIEVSDDSLTIHAQKSQAKETKDKNYIRKERSAQTFYRQVPLPEKIRSDDAKANLNDGILEVTLPKKEPKKTKKLAITGAGIGSEPKHTQGHSIAVTQSKDGEFMCPECGKTFDNKDVAEKHLHSEHQEHLRAVHHETHGKDTDKKHQK